MLGFVIGGDDVIRGFRLVGLEGQEVTSVSEARQALTKAIARKEVAIVLVSEEFSTQMSEEIEKVRLERLTPLIVEIPGPKGSTKENRMSDFIRKTLGIKT
jgi:V/A-type H+/Na+-transporting ATPase subunit F